MSFHVGQHVVCVDDTPDVGRRKRYFFGLFRRFVPTRKTLVRGKVYRIIWFGYGTEFDSGATVAAVRVDGIYYPINQAHPASRFRPLDESRLDIFRAHLAPSPKQKVPA